MMIWILMLLFGVFAYKIRTTHYPLKPKHCLSAVVVQDNDKDKGGWVWWGICLMHLPCLLFIMLNKKIDSSVIRPCETVPWAVQIFLLHLYRRMSIFSPLISKLLLTKSWVTLSLHLVIWQILLCNTTNKWGTIQTINWSEAFRRAIRLADDYWCIANDIDRGKEAEKDWKKK